MVYFISELSNSEFKKKEKSNLRKGLEVGASVAGLGLLAGGSLLALKRLRSLKNIKNVSDIPQSVVKRTEPKLLPPAKVETPKTTTVKQDKIPDPWYTPIEKVSTPKTIKKKKRPSRVTVKKRKVKSYVKTVNGKKVSVKGYDRKVKIVEQNLPTIKDIQKSREQSPISSTDKLIQDNLGLQLNKPKALLEIDAVLSKPPFQISNKKLRSVLVKERRFNYELQSILRTTNFRSSNKLEKVVGLFAKEKPEVLNNYRKSVLNKVLEDITDLNKRSYVNNQDYLDDIDLTIKTASINRKQIDNALTKHFDNVYVNNREDYLYSLIGQDGLTKTPKQRLLLAKQHKEAVFPKGRNKLSDDFDESLNEILENLQLEKQRVKRNQIRIVDGKPKVFETDPERLKRIEETQNKLAEFYSKPEEIKKQMEDEFLDNLANPERVSRTVLKQQVKDYFSDSLSDPIVDDIVDILLKADTWKLKGKRILEDLAKRSEEYSDAFETYGNLTITRRDLFKTIGKGASAQRMLKMRNNMAIILRNPSKATQAYKELYNDFQLSKTLEPQDSLLGVDNLLELPMSLLEANVRRNLFLFFNSIEPNTSYTVKRSWYRRLFNPFSSYFDPEKSIIYRDLQEKSSIQGRIKRYVRQRTSGVVENNRFTLDGRMAIQNEKIQLRKAKEEIRRKLRKEKRQRRFKKDINKDNE